jgi:type VI secretion system protein ImpK
MGRDDPFGLADDSGRTRLRPVAAPRRLASAALKPGAPLKRSRVHPNPLVNAFAALLEFAPELENAVSPENPDTMLTRLHDEIVTARDAAVASGASLARADAAAWAVAALLDDLALNTPWGGASAWPRQPLVVILSGDVDAGVRFFTRLEELTRYPDRDRELLELHYLCLALGFRGKYRVPGRAGNHSISAVRTAAARFLRDVDAENAPLSPNWQGIVAADEPARFIVPIWVLAAVAVVLATAIYVGLSMRLGVQADGLATLVRALPPPEQAEIYRPQRREPPPDAPPVQVVEFKLLPVFQAAAPPDLLQAMKGRESISLTTLVIQETSPEVFQSARAQLTERFEPLISSIATVIRENADLIGKVTVVGHTDSVPLQSSNPLSTNQRLSEARAVTIADILVANGVPRERVRTEGRGTTKPVAGNDTREGRALNRRVEVLIEKRL